MLDNGGIIARRIVELPDRDEDMGAMLLRNLMWRLNDQVGDGTATAAVLSQSVYRQGIRHLAAGGNAMQLQCHLKGGLKVMLDILSGMTLHLHNKENLAQIAESICHNALLAKMLGEIFDTIGEYGRLEVKRSEAMTQTTGQDQAGHNLEGYMYCLAASPDFEKDGICFAALETGLYRSDSRGVLWRVCYDLLKIDSGLVTTAVAISPTFSFDRGVFAAVQGSILRSNDGGSTWHGTAFPIASPLISSLVISPNFAYDGTLLAGTIEDGVFRSTDRGQRWSPANFGLLDLQIFSMAISLNFVQDETVFLGTETSIYCSTNSGRAWRDLEPPGDLGPVLSVALTPTFDHDRTVFAGTETSGLWVSRDRGYTWTRLIDANLGPINGVILAPGSHTVSGVLLVLGESLLISLDGGQSWSECNVDLPPHQGVVVALAPYGSVSGAPLLIGLTGGGVVRTQCKG